MSKIFTDSGGREYEEAKGEIIPYDKNGIYFPPNVQLIRPVKPEPYVIEATANNSYKRQIDIRCDNIPEAQLIKEAVEALMEYLFAPYDYENPAQHISADREEIWHKARHSLMRENN